MHLGPRPRAATASCSLVESPDRAPYAWTGRLYVRQGGEEGVCSVMAIDSPSRRLVLTAGRCVDNGPKDGKSGVRSTDLEFVPGLDAGEGNPAFHLGALLTERNAEGTALTDAGGATIVTDRGRPERQETFGYPGSTERMRTRVSSFAGVDPITATLAGPNTAGIRCDWRPGASGAAG
ncbi:MAG TPA: hypothetical protein VHA80_07055 [Solirubrobacterales bacterium]|nr:hypothetical protein [Solirubrobacterales bacterium]